MAAELIGRCRCPLCRNDKARLSLAKSGLPVITCNGCNFQGFARSDRSDDRLRELLLPTQDKPTADTEQALPAQVTETAPEPATAHEPARATSSGWGFFRS